MSKVMLYRHPRVLKANDEKKGFVVIGGIHYDWIVVKEDEVDACLEQGFFTTHKEALEASLAEEVTTEDENVVDTDDVSGDEVTDEVTDEGDQDEDTEAATEEDETPVSDETFTITLGDLEGKTADEIKDAYTVEELQVLAKTVSVKRATRMNEDTLVEKLLEKLEG